MIKLNELLVLLLVLSVLIIPSISAINGADTLRAGSEGLFVLPLTTDPTSTTVSCAPSTIVGGQSTTCSATVTDANLITPTGTVSFTVTGGTGTIGSSCTIAGGTPGSASCSVTYTPTSGACSFITGSYAGDTAHLPSNSSPFAVGAKCVTFTESAETAQTGQMITVTITATGSPTTLTVYWGDGTVDSGTITTYSHAYSAAGTFMVYVTAMYSDGSMVQSTTASKVISACVPSSTAVGDVCFTTNAGQLTNLVAVSESSLPTAGKPAVSFPFGFFSFTITGIASGSTVTVTITYPSAVPTQYWKVVNGVWTDLTLCCLSFSSTNPNVLYLSLTDGGTGDSDSILGQITDPGGVGRGDSPPVAAFTFSPASASVGQTVNYDASSSYDPDGTISNYLWTFGDSATGAGVTTTHVYATPNTYTVTLTVTDNAGLIGQNSAQIVVSQGLPGAHVSFFQWSARPQFKKFSITRQGPIEPIQAFAVNDGNKTVWSQVRFVVTADSGVNQVLYTQVVQLTPGQEINGNQDPRFAANFVPTTPGTYFIQATVYYSTSSTQPPVGDPSFITTPPNNVASNSFLVRP